MKKYKERTETADRDRAAKSFFSGKIAIPPGPRLGAFAMSSNNPAASADALLSVLL